MFSKYYKDLYSSVSVHWHITGLSWVSRLESLWEKARLGTGKIIWQKNRWRKWRSGRKSIFLAVISSLFMIWSKKFRHTYNKPKGLKVAKADQMADRNMIGHDVWWLIGMMDESYDSERLRGRGWGLIRIIADRYDVWYAICMMAEKWCK